LRCRVALIRAVATIRSSTSWPNSEGASPLSIRPTLLSGALGGIKEMIELLRPIVLVGIIGFIYFLEHVILTAGGSLPWFTPNMNMCRFCGKTLLDRLPENTRVLKRWGTLHNSCAKRVQFSRWCWFVALCISFFWFFQKTYFWVQTWIVGIREG